MPKNYYQGGLIASPCFFLNILGEETLLLPSITNSPSLPIWAIRNLEDLQVYLTAGGSFYGLAQYLYQMGFENSRGGLAEAFQRNIPAFEFPSNVHILKHEGKYLVIRGEEPPKILNSGEEIARLFGLALCLACHHWSQAPFYRENFRGRGVICRNCTDSLLTCPSCDEDMLRADSRAITGRSGRYCYDCASQYRHCEHCDEFHTERYCPNADLDNDIQEHGYAPPIAPKGNKERSRFPFFIGMELEVPTREPVETLKQMRKKYGDLFWGVYDGSVEGVELVSQPATYEYWREWELKIHGSARDLGDAGIHLHVCRNGFTHDQVKLMLSFFANNKRFIKGIAQRDDKLAQWAKIQDLAYYERAARNLATWVGGDKYSAINFCHSKTFEFRIFQSSIQNELIKKNFDFVSSLWDYTKNGDISGEPSLKTYKDFVFKSDYPFLQAFMKKTGLAEV